MMINHGPAICLALLAANASAETLTLRPDPGRACHVLIFRSGDEAVTVNAKVTPGAFSRCVAYSGQPSRIMWLRKNAIVSETRLHSVVVQLTTDTGRDFPAYEAGVIIPAATLSKLRRDLVLRMEYGDGRFFVAPWKKDYAVTLLRKARP